MVSSLSRREVSHHPRDDLPHPPNPMSPTPRNPLYPSSFSLSPLRTLWPPSLLTPRHLRRFCLALIPTVLLLLVFTYSTNPHLSPHPTPHSPSPSPYSTPTNSSSPPSPSPLPLFLPLTLTIPSPYTTLTPLPIRTPPPPTQSSPDTQAWLTSHVLYFLHVPKTAGQTFVTLLRYVTRPYELAYRRRAAPLAPRLDLTFMRREHIIHTLTPPQRAHFTALYSRQLTHLGHSDALIARAFTDARRATDFLTLLRHPVDRVFSHFCYAAKNASHNDPLGAARALQVHRATWPTWTRYVNRTLDAWSAASFKEFVRGQGVDGFDNWHTRAYAGCLHTVVVAEAEQPALCDDPVQMLAEAKRALAGFLYLGLTEHYAESEVLLLYTLHYDPELYRYKARPRASVNRNRKKKECMAVVTNEGREEAQLRLWIGQMERLDVELYAFAEELFWRRMKAVPPGPHWEVQLNRTLRDRGPVKMHDRKRDKAADGAEEDAEAPADVHEQTAAEDKPAD